MQKEKFMSPERRFLLACLVIYSLPALQAGELSTTKPGPIEVIWNDPGVVERLDFEAGPGGRARAPREPFQFLEEDLEGTNPKVKVRDALGAIWSVKWGDEVHSDIFASRIAWAAGYVVQPMHFVASGTIQNARDLKRLKCCIGPDGSFKSARFQLRDPRLRFMENDDWTWSFNPFVGTRELNGLKVIMMLTSNWDNKDARDADRGSNTGIFEDSLGGRSRYSYFVADWGGSMGKWGGVFGREKWHSQGFASQTPDFIKKVEGEKITWGYRGQHTSDTTDGITLSDVQWILQYVGRISDEQLRAGLRASGATPSEVEVFTSAIRARIDQMRAVIGPTIRIRTGFTQATSDTH
jgi:hypothetical protein